MEITKEHARQIERITRDMECPKDFVCRTSGFERLGKTKLVAEGQRVECLEENARLCKLALRFGHLTICECPLRRYIAKNFHI